MSEPPSRRLYGSRSGSMPSVPHNVSMVTSFRVGHGGWLTYADRAASGGLLPIGLTSNEEGDVLYAGDELTGTIQGFHVSHNGRLSWIIVSHAGQLGDGNPFNFPPSPVTSRPCACPVRAR
jgi:hypothetical protein